MDYHVLLAVLLGVVAVAGGAFSIFTAVQTRRNRAEIAETYATTGGPVYTAVQFGCGGALIVAGLAVIAAVLLVPR